MSIWLQMARDAEATEALANSVRTRDKTDRTDKTPTEAGQNRVLSEAERFCPSDEIREKPSNSGGSGGFVRSVPMSEGRTEETANPDVLSETPKPGCMVRLAWSGEWVSADRYATMTDRERHGPQGRFWCGKCRQERERETVLRCLDGEACQ